MFEKKKVFQYVNSPNPPEIVEQRFRETPNEKLQKNLAQVSNLKKQFSESTQDNKKKQIKLLEESLTQRVKCQKCSGFFSPVLIPTPFYKEIDRQLEGCGSCANIKCGFDLDDFDPNDVFSFFKEKSEPLHFFESKRHASMLYPKKRTSTPSSSERGS